MKPALFALHGVGTSPALWDDVRAAMPEYLWLTPDLGGLALEHPTFEGLVAALDAACPRGAVVAASSFACNVAIALAAVRPDLRGLLLSGVGPLHVDGARRAQLEGLVDPIRHMNPDIAGAFVDALAPAVCEAEALKRARMRLRALILAPGRTGGDVAMLRIALPDLDAFVCASRVPVVVFHGSADTTVDPSWPSAWVRATTAAPAELHELPDVGHYPALHVPELVAEILRSLAARQPSAVTTAP